MELIPTKHWRHVSGLQNPADCASRGLFPSELLEHSLWWHGPEWLKLSSTEWPKLPLPSHTVSTDGEKEICVITSVVVPETSVLNVENYSSYTKLKRITAWIMRFAYNCRALKRNLNRKSSSLQVEELMSAERYLLLIAQQNHFSKEIKALKNNKDIPKSSCLLPLHPFVDSSMLLRVGGREQNSKASYASQHPIILHGNHPLTKLIVLSEHLRLLHAGAQLVTSMLSLSFHIIGHRKLIRSITRGCITCRRHAVKPKPQILGQLPMERVTPDTVFDRIGVDYAGPIYVKYGYVRKPTVVKTYVCVFVSLTVKAVHLELVSDLSTDAFIACLRRFISRRGIPGLIWSDHGSNFVGAARELKELSEFLELQKTQKEISEFCTSVNIHWKFIPERSPHFGGIWEAAVKSFKSHLKRIVGPVKLTFEEMTTVLTQIEACLNSRPLSPMPFDDDGVQALTSGHFLIGRPLNSLTDPSFTCRPISLLRRWHLCQSLMRNFWKRWHAEYPQPFASMQSGITLPGTSVWEM